jgi:7-keto-8-aminopelargonate synthetase-like enzyme
VLQSSFLFVSLCLLLTSELFLSFVLGFQQQLLLQQQQQQQQTTQRQKEHCGIQDLLQEHGVIINSTLGKALGGATGGYTTGPKEVVGLLRQRSRPYLFSNSLAPSVAGASLEVFKMLSKDSSLVNKVQENTKRFRERMVAAGFKVSGDPSHPICPVMLGDARLAQDFASGFIHVHISGKLSFFFLM